MLQLLWIKSHKCHNPIFSRYQLMFWLQQFFFYHRCFLIISIDFFFYYEISFIKVFKIHNIYKLHLSNIEVYTGSFKNFSNAQTQLFIISRFWNVGCLILNFNVKIFVHLIYIVNHISLSARRKLENEYPYTRGGN